jgi:hypothetical protein
VKRGLIKIARQKTAAREHFRLAAGFTDQPYFKWLMGGAFTKFFSSGTLWKKQGWIPGVDVVRPFLFIKKQQQIHK